MIDNVPHEKPEHHTWVMRPRCRTQEIGPEFRFNGRLQVQRVMDSLTKETCKYFDKREICNGPRGFKNDDAVKTFVKTGEWDYVPGLRGDDYESDTDLHEDLKRDHKLNQTNYVVPPKKIMASLHRKTHFRGATAVGLSVNNMKINTKLFNEDFIEIANNLPSMQEKVRAVAKTTLRAHSQSTQKRTSRISKNTATLNPDEEDARLDKLQKMRNQQIDYCGLSNEVLRMTNYQRKPEAATAHQFTRKGAGIGGWGKMDERARTTAGYGRTGFGKRPSTSNWLGAGVSPRDSIISGNSMVSPSTMHSSIVHSESRGVIVRKK